MLGFVLFILGVFAGTGIGVAIMALCAAADDDRYDIL